MTSGALRALLNGIAHGSFVGGTGDTQRLVTMREVLIEAQRKSVADLHDVDRLIELADDKADIRAAEAAYEEMRRTKSETIPFDQGKWPSGRDEK